MLDSYLTGGSFDVTQDAKEEFLLRELNSLTRYHFENCPDYARIIGSLWENPRSYKSLRTLPFLPVSVLSHWTSRAYRLRKLRSC